MSCINYPSNYRVIMETSNTANSNSNNNTTNSSNHPTVPVQSLSPVQCPCQRGLHQQQQPKQHRPYQQAQSQQQQQQQQNVLSQQRQHQLQQQMQQQQQQQQQLQQLQQQQQQLQQQQQHQQPQKQQQLPIQQLPKQLTTCILPQPLEQPSTNSKSSPQSSQNSQASTSPASTGPFIKNYYTRTTSESGGQLSCGCPFEISISSAHPPARPSYEIRLPSGMAAMCVSGKGSISDEEFYSLSSASSDRDDCAALRGAGGQGGGKVNVDSETKKEFLDCECGSPTPDKNTSNNPPRNAAILELLREVVQLINQADENGNGCGCGVAPTKIRKLGEEDSTADNGPFSSGIKITFTPSRKGTSPCPSNAQTEMSEAGQQAVAQPVNIPLQLPCNLIITPNLLTCSPCAQCGGQKQQAQQKCDTPKGGPKTAKVAQSMKKAYCTDKEMSCSCIGDLELIEEIAALALAADPKKCAEPCGQASEGNDPCGGGAGASASASSRPAAMQNRDNSDACSKLCPEECICDQPCLCPVHGLYLPPSTRDDQDCSQTVEEEECGCIEENGIATEPSQSQTHVSTAASCTTNDTKKSNGSECSCCHCQAMREQKNCMAVATADQTRDQCSCSELKFFIDSIIMDLDAMEKARRKKQCEQNTKPTRARVCPRQSFPVTITEVSELGSSSLYVKWVIHDCCGIGGYEIYVDGYLTNRYFHCNHEAAVVCDVDVTRPHKIVLVAQPKQPDCSCGDNMENQCKELMRKSDAEKMDKNMSPSALWMPSIYMYDPCDKTDAPAINRGDGY